MQEKMGDAGGKIKRMPSLKRFPENHQTFKDIYPFCMKYLLLVRNGPIVLDSSIAAGSVLVNYYYKKVISPLSVVLTLSALSDLDYSGTLHCV